MPQVSEVNAIVATLFNPLESSGPTPMQDLFEPSHRRSSSLGKVPAESWGRRPAHTTHAGACFLLLPRGLQTGFPSLSSCKHTYRQMKYLICFSKSLGLLDRRREI